MTLTPTDLEAAAFWDRLVCLDCAASIESDEWVEVCPECGSAELLPAKKVLKVLDLIEREGEGDERG